MTLKIQPKDLIELVNAPGTINEDIIVKTASTLFSLLLFLREGYSVAFDNITIESAGNNILFVSTEVVTPEEIIENLEDDFNAKEED